MADLEQLVEDLSNLTLLEASQLTKMLEEKWGVSAAAPAAAMMPMPSMMPSAADGSGEAEAAEEQTEFDVILKAAGGKKIQVIKAVRGMRSDLGLKEAKAVVDDAPSPILESVSKEEAEEAKGKLEAEGAEVEIK